MKKYLFICIALLLSFSSFSQEAITDSSKTLDEVLVRSFEQNRNARSATAAVKLIELNNSDRYNKSSLVNGFNTVAGVRMEERSPGSYRINIRGSSLRSPFGVRNVKVYWNNIPITDPGGNTYFNQFAHNNFSYIEIFKGPAGSLYGAGTGGLVLLNNLDRWQPGISLEYITGSYNLQNVLASARFGKKENKNQITYAHNQTDGYRVQSKMRRDNFSWQSLLKVSDKHELSASVLFNDMYYQTPGALTLAEYTTNPKAARPAGGGFPSAENAHAAIFQKNITVGFTNSYTFQPGFKNNTTLYGAFSQVKNSAIRNYERRNEPSYGGRSVFMYTKKKETIFFQLTGGGEFQQGLFNTQVSNNRNGNPDTLQTNDDVTYTTYSLFAQGDININESWLLNAGISLNKSSVSFRRLSTYPVTTQKRSYKNEFAPRLSLRKNFSDRFHAKATVSRGFSPPTIGELLPSTGVISTALEAENGWNMEAGLHADLFRNTLRLEVTGFSFKLNNALVQRRDLSGADFFVNAGNVKQKGIEAHADYLKSFPEGKWINYYNLRADYTFSHFRYGSFVKGADDFSGKTVPSVPSQTVSLLGDICFSNGIYFSATYYAASKLFLNDANTAFADPYHLLGMRLGWTKKLKEHKLNFYFGADNLLNERYSLGNDINAAANRFYNAAAPRNYYAGISWQWIKKK